MTICLITPPSGFLLDERVFVSLGILRVAAVLEQAGHIVEHLDLNGVTNYEEAVRDHAARSEAAVYGLTATTPQMPAAAKIAAVLRQVRPDARLILGGPHATLVNAGARREARTGRPHGRATWAKAVLESLFDTVVAGDGERAVHIAIRHDAPQCIDADDPQGPLFLASAELDALPLPARHLVDIGSYHYAVDGAPALSLIAQLGCPFGCGFCGGRESPMLRRVRMRSTQSVVAEVRHLWETYGAAGMMLYDDELNVNPRMLELMDALAAEQERLDVRWRLRGFVKSQLFTEAQAAAMYRAGFRWILVGFESGSPRMLANMHKQATREQNSACVQMARRAGLRVKALMSLGHPGESAETIAETRNWLLTERPDDFDATIITTYPGSPYYDQALPVAGEPGVWCYWAPVTGDRLYAEEIDYTEVADYYKGAPDGGYRAYVWTDYLTPKELVEERDALEREVRGALGISFNAGAPGVRYEASMGQLPGSILRRSGEAVPCA